MKTQSFKNHAQMVPGYHYLLSAILLATLIGSLINLFHSSCENLYSASLITALTLGVILLTWFTRSFAMKVQDRAIRAEENLRHFIMTGKPLASNLKLSQIIALRFAPDEEFVALAKKASDESLSVKDIKKLIKNWKGDYYRA